MSRLHGELVWERLLGASPVHLFPAATSLELVAALTCLLSDILQPCSPVSHHCQSLGRGTDGLDRLPGSRVTAYIFCSQSCSGEAD